MSTLLSLRFRRNNDEEKQIYEPIRKVKYAFFLFFFDFFDVLFSPLSPGQCAQIKTSKIV